MTNNSRCAHCGETRPDDDFDWLSYHEDACHVEKLQAENTALALRLDAIRTKCAAVPPPINEHDDFAGGRYDLADEIFAMLDDAPSAPSEGEKRDSHCGHREGHKVCILPPGHDGAHLSG